MHAWMVVHEGWPVEDSHAAPACSSAFKGPPVAVPVLARATNNAADGARLTVVRPGSWPGPCRATTGLHFQFGSEGPLHPPRGVVRGSGGARARAGAPGRHDSEERCGARSLTVAVDGQGNPVCCEARTTRGLPVARAARGELARRGAPHGTPIPTSSSEQAPPSVLSRRMLDGALCRALALSRCVLYRRQDAKPAAYIRPVQRGIHRKRFACPSAGPYERASSASRSWQTGARFTEIACPARQVTGRRESHSGRPSNAPRGVAAQRMGPLECVLIPALRAGLTREPLVPAPKAWGEGPRRERVRSREEPPPRRWARRRQFEPLARQPMEEQLLFCPWGRRLSHHGPVTSRHGQLLRR